jgi:hypothetical protein
MSDTDIHSCGYYCDRHACILRQRDELRDKLFEEIHTSEGSIQTSDTKPAESARAWVNLTDEEINDVFGDYMDSLDDGEEDDNWGYERLLEAKIKEKNT